MGGKLGGKHEFVKVKEHWFSHENVLLKDYRVDFKKLQLCVRGGPNFVRYVCVKSTLGC